MIEVSTLIGKPVLSLATSSIIGNVSDVYFVDYAKKAEYFCIETSDGNSPMLLPFSEAQSISDAVVIADATKLLSPNDVDITSLQSGLMSMPVYTQSGGLKGEVSEIMLNSAGKVMKLYMGDDETTPSNISAIGDIMLLKGVNKTKSKARKTTIPRPEKDYPVYILESAASENANAATEAEEKATATQTTSPQITSAQNLPQLQAVKQDTATEYAPQIHSVDQATATQYASKMPKIQVKAESYAPKAPIALSTDSREPVLSNGAFEVLLDGSSDYSYDEDAHTPTRVICDYAFLLGRTLGADLCTYTGELIAKQGSSVTESVVEKARRAGKLVELTLNSIKPERKN